MAEISAAPSKPNRERTFQHLIARGDRLLQQAQATSARFSRWRMIIFLTGAAACVIPYRMEWYHLGNAMLALFIAIFFVVARYHSKLESKMQRLRLWLGIKRKNLARLRLDWEGIPLRPDSETRLPTENHPYAADLDLVGRYSLLRLLDCTISTNGRERLETWLLSQTSDPPDPIRWGRRQGLVRELAGQSRFRDRLVLEALLVGDAEINGQRIQAVLQTPAAASRLVPLLTLQAALAATTISLGAATVVAGLPGYWVLSFATYVAIFFLTIGRTAPAFSHALSLHDELDKVGAVFRFLERGTYGAAPLLGDLCRTLIGGTTRPSLYLARLARVCQALSIRANPLVHLTTNALIPWDLFFTYRLGQLQGQVQHEVPEWLDRLAELEAASALAGFAFLNPAYVWPTPVEAQAEGGSGNGRPAVVTARALGHPLIPARQRVTNDIELHGIGRVVVITGSNMSGKSTFLRTVGINVCLAQAGGPVCAAAFEWSWTRAYCCIRVDDSLEAGLSFFYAEVKRLKRLLDAAQARHQLPVLFLIDEIFKGTNNRERLIGSGAFIRALAGSNGLGFITTHDLELADLEKEIPGITNVHFRETVEANQLQFDYRLRQGPCPTTNALRIMALEGLPVPDP